MRIISGVARGRKLTEPKGDVIRPTSGKVKEAMFSIVQFDIEGRQVLDLYAGTGQLGAEALSRGAKSAVFVDSSAESVKLIRKNLQICGFSEYAMVYNIDVLSYLSYEEKFDLIFIDPPYRAGLVNKTVEKLIEFDKLHINGIIICEYDVKNAINCVAKPYSIEKTYRYGKSAIAKIVRNE